MRVILLLAAIIVAVNASLSINEQWRSFKVQHNKQYDLIENKMRFGVFQDSLRKIEEHNKKYEQGEVSYYLKVTKFADWTDEEFLATLNLQVTDVPSEEKEKLTLNYTRPSSFDWRDKNAVGPVKDQGQCGGCWAFSITGSLEGQLRIHNNDNVLLSEQELIDCVRRNDGCHGGDPNVGLEYVKSNGLSSEDQYPYVHEDGKCKNINAKDKPLEKTAGSWFVTPGEDNLADAVAEVGPITIALAVSDNFKLYAGGVFSGECDGQIFNHGLLAVGYTDNYWIIKNSWSAGWGEKGYIKLQRGDGLCRIGQYGIYPKL